MTQLAQPPPRLAPPGAGIPAVERWIGRTLFALRWHFGTRDSFTQEFLHEQSAIEGLRRPLDDGACRTRVLIPRLRGLEDSSRYWSLWMTLDHLRIVNSQIARLIGDLLRDQAPAGKASTAAVKPREDVGPEVANAYEEACAGLLQIVAGAHNLHTRLRYAHPWFGPLDAAGWHAMAAMHMGIHRAQVERIVEGLGRGPVR